MERGDTEKLTKEYHNWNYRLWFSIKSCSRINKKRKGDTMSEYNAKKVGLRIKEKRKEMKMTQEVLANKICISDKYLGIVELGKQNMSAEILLNLAIALNISSDYLLGYDDAKTQ